ncbi:MAG: c-type cytochrome [Myxococcales bacterium]|nr:c-type cytochrome [Myxococcales bacterium]
MLSKSAARAFFIGGTVIVSAAFIGLTVDTLGQVPERSNESEMTDAVKRGHEIWNDNNCMGCHTILGEGAYYAPELTKVVSRRGAEWIKVFIKDPEAMYPGRRKMVKYDFTDAQIDDLIAYFSWIGKIDTNGFPPEPDLKIGAGSSAQKSANAHAGAPPSFKTLCVACHALEGSGGNVGPALDGVANRYDQKTLDAWLKDPPSVKPGTKMPKLPLTDAQRSALVSFLMTKKSQK